MTNEAAYAAAARMWFRLGRIATKRAHDLAEKGLPHASLRFAKLADAAFYMSTGEGVVQLKDLESPSASDDGGRG